MSVQSFLHTIDGISTWVGKAAAWLMIVLMSVVCIEVFKRYIMNMPTSWIFDLNNMLYGSLFMLCGAYTLAQNAHVRGDFLYSSMRPRTQASLDLVLYIIFFLPGIAWQAHVGGLLTGGAIGALYSYTGGRRASSAPASAPTSWSVHYLGLTAIAVLLIALSIVKLTIA